MGDNRLDTNKLCPICGKPMTKLEVKSDCRDYEMWTCVPCVKEADKGSRKEGRPELLSKDMGALR